MNNADIYELRDYYQGFGFDKIPKKGLVNEYGKTTGTNITLSLKHEAFSNYMGQKIEIEM